MSAWVRLTPLSGTCSPRMRRSPVAGPPPHIVTEEGLSWPIAGESRVRDHELEAQWQASSLGGPLVPSVDAIITGHVVSEQALYPFPITIPRVHIECFLGAELILQDMVMNKPQLLTWRTHHLQHKVDVWTKPYVPTGAPQGCMSIIQGGAHKTFTSSVALFSFQ